MELVELEVQRFESKFDGELSEIFSLQNGLLKNVRGQFLDKVKEYLRGNLAQLGFTFDNDDLLMKFFEERVTQIETSHDPSIYDLYLDYKSSDDLGTWVGRYRDDMSINFDAGAGAVTITIG